jgi:hypothetical protein
MEVFVPRHQRLFEDEIVLALLPPLVKMLLKNAAIRAAFISLSEAFAPGIRGALLCRTRRIDEAVRVAAARPSFRFAGIPPHVCGVFTASRGKRLPPQIGSGATACNESFRKCDFSSGEGRTYGWEFRFENLGAPRRSGSALTPDSQCLFFKMIQLER